MTLYFGCRHSNGDYIFREELKGFLDKGILNKLITAFSRDQDEKIYVQDRINQNIDDIFDSLTEGKAILYICG